MLTCACPSKMPGECFPGLCIQNHSAQQLGDVVVTFWVILPPPHPIFCGLEAYSVSVFWRNNLFLACWLMVASLKRLSEEAQLMAASLKKLSDGASWKFCGNWELGQGA